jgi:succinate dehydrogenase / fumarate reductase cytochrome b subunit
MSTIETRPVGQNRPLSPHLEIYRFTWTMAMSIVHRITGIALYVGTLLLAAWLLSAASGKGAYDSAQWVFGSFLGRLVLFGYTWALLHHLIGGIRHFVWDVGSGYDPRTRQTMAMGNLVLSITLTLVIWIIGYIVR